MSLRPKPGTSNLWPLSYLTQKRHSSHKRSCFKGLGHCNSVDFCHGYSCTFLSGRKNNLRLHTGIGLPFGLFLRIALQFDKKSDHHQECEVVRPNIVNKARASALLGRVRVSYLCCVRWQWQQRQHGDSFYWPLCSLKWRDLKRANHWKNWENSFVLNLKSFGSPGHAEALHLCRLATAKEWKMSSKLGSCTSRNQNLASGCLQIKDLILFIGMKEAKTSEMPALGRILAICTLDWLKLSLIISQTWVWLMSGRLWRQHCRNERQFNVLTPFGSRSWVMQPPLVICHALQRSLYIALQWTVTFYSCTKSHNSSHACSRFLILFVNCKDFAQKPKPEQVEVPDRIWTQKAQHLCTEPSQQVLNSSFLAF